VAVLSRRQIAILVSPLHTSIPIIFAVGKKRRMKLLYLTRDNLRNSPFIKDLIFHHKLEESSLILHDHFGSIQDTRFVTKRLSALMSEDMVVNNAFSGDQRRILSLSKGELQVRKELIEEAYVTVSLFILNPIVATEDGPAAHSPVEVLQMLRREFGIDEILLFPRNSLSPIAASREVISQPEDVERLLRLYDEETELLEMARALAPTVLAAPKNMLAGTS
jgi:hypothetical protein